MHSLLIIDDDADTCFSLSELLTLEGYSCVCATGGREGLRLLESKPPDLAIVDFELPDMDGAEFLKTKAEIPSVAAIPVIVVTAHRTSRCWTALSLGCTSHSGSTNSSRCCGDTCRRQTTPMRRSHRCPAGGADRFRRAD